MSNENIRDAAVRIAKSYEDLSGDPKSPRYEEYLQAIAPGEIYARQVEMAKMSGCALTVAGIWRAIGITHASLDAPYRDGSAVSRLYELARKAGALRSPYPGSMPQPGDVVWVGQGGVEHVYTVLDVREDVIVGMDGGQRDDHHFQAVELKEHVWAGLSERSRYPGGLLGVTRSINGWWDLESLHAYCLYGG